MSLTLPLRICLEDHLVHSTTDSVTGTSAGGVASSMTGAGETFACGSPSSPDLTFTWNSPSAPTVSARSRGAHAQAAGLRATVEE